MERLERYTTASDFFQADKTRTECIADAKSVQDELDALQAEQEEYLSVANGQNSQIEELTQSKEQEMGSEFKEIEQQVTEKSKKMVRASRPRWIKCPRSHVSPAHRSKTLRRGKIRRRPTTPRLRPARICGTALRIRRSSSRR